MDETMQREIIRDLSNKDLIDELNTPTSNYRNDLVNEALCRLLKSEPQEDKGIIVPNEIVRVYHKDIECDCDLHLCKRILTISKNSISIGNKDTNIGRKGFTVTDKNRAEIVKAIQEIYFPMMNARLGEVK